MKINKKYILIFNIEGKILTFTGEIISDDGMFISFIDKFGDMLSYNKSNLVSYREVKQ